MVHTGGLCFTCLASHTALKTLECGMHYGVLTYKHMHGACCAGVTERVDSGRASLLDNGPVQSVGGGVEMALLAAPGDAELAAELAAVATSAPKPGKLKRSNSIMF